MSRTNEGEALHAFIADINRQLARFTQQPIFASRGRDEPHYTLTFRRPARLTRDLQLVVRHYCAIQGNHVLTAGYHYALEDADAREIIVYHWHPSASPTEPHIHLKTGAAVGRQDLARAHIPTGEVTWSELLWLLREIT